MRNKISIWLVTIIVFSAAFFFIGNHVCTESNKEAANSEVYKYPSAAFGLSEIESISPLSVQVDPFFPFKLGLGMFGAGYC